LLLLLLLAATATAAVVVLVVNQDRAAPVALVRQSRWSSVSS